MKNHIKTDEVHAEDRLNPSVETPGIFCHVPFVWALWTNVGYHTTDLLKSSF